MLRSCKHIVKLEMFVLRDQQHVQELVDGLVDCLSGEIESTSTCTTLRELIIHWCGNLHDLEERIQDLLVTGFEKNSSLHQIQFTGLSLEHKRRMKSCLRRNRFIAYAKSLDKVALAASRVAVVDALRGHSQDEEGTNASWLIIRQYANLLFSPPNTP
jgi:hypothetical protein